MILTCEQIQLENYQKPKENRINDDHRVQRGLEGCPGLGMTWPCS